ncbi:hypothetical protein F5Y17DRAFT_20863 [Xylariaceae sp. FL0594]|nr:hypothetical protein F5Y17DRAFT_20863 [Xylariaceae sp. FL0594]
MQFATLALSFLAAMAAAQDANNNSTSLPDLVAQLPTCAIPCFNTGAESAGCATTDFDCLCTRGKDQIIASAGPCVFKDCESDDFGKLSTLLTQICTEVSENPSPSEVASASNIVTSALAAATPSDPASRPELGYGLMGVAAAAALLL